MELTHEEEEILNGRHGEELAKVLEVIVKVGEALEAKRLVNVTHAHISGISYKNIGDAGLEFIEKLASSTLRVSIPATVNPAGMDIKKWRKMGVKQEFAEKQLRILGSLRKLGFKMLLTCTPYLYEKIPPGSQVAWAESNAVLYANSILNLYTNREGGPLALLEAIVGKAPLYGYRLEENRRPGLVIDFSDIKRTIKERELYQAIGYYVGTIAKFEVPLIKNYPSSLLQPDNVKLFLAAVGASGSVALVRFHGEGGNLERYRPNIDDVYSALPADFSDEGTILMGCPHLSAREIRWLADIVKRWGKPKRRVIIFTARVLENSMYKDIVALSRAGIEVYFDTCMVVADLKSMGVDKPLVDSAKAAYYLSSQGYDVRLFSRKDILRVFYGDSV